MSRKTTIFYYMPLVLIVLVVVAILAFTLKSSSGTTSGWYTVMLGLILFLIFVILRWDYVRKKISGISIPKFGKRTSAVPVSSTPANKVKKRDGYWFSVLKVFFKVILALYVIFATLALILNLDNTETITPSNDWVTVETPKEEFFEYEAYGVWAFKRPDGHIDTGYSGRNIELGHLDEFEVIFIDSFGYKNPRVIIFHGGKK